VNWRLLKLNEVSEKASAYAVEEAHSNNPNISTPAKTFGTLTLMNYLLDLDRTLGRTADIQGKNAAT
jgi:hypothetical protein